MSDYQRDPRGFLVRIKPKTFRRGRSVWVGGHSVTTIESTGGKKHLTAPRSRWQGDTRLTAGRVKVHSKKA